MHVDHHKDRAHNDSQSKPEIFKRIEIIQNMFSDRKEIGSHMFSIETWQRLRKHSFSSTNGAEAITTQKISAEPTPHISWKKSLKMHHRAKWDS